MNTKRLKIQGRVSAHVLKKLFQNKEVKKKEKNEEWLFVSYAEATFSRGTLFDIIIPSNETAWNHEYKIRLLKITDEYARTFTEVPQGYKTICLFGFTDSYPKLIRQLPLLDGWSSKTNSIYLCRHSDINLLEPEKNLQQEQRIFFDLFLAELNKTYHNKIITLNEFEHFLSAAPSFRTDKHQKQSDLMQDIINKLLLLGKAKKRDDQLILTQE